MNKEEDIIKVALTYGIAEIFITDKLVKIFQQDNNVAILKYNDIKFLYEQIISIKKD